MGTDQAPSPLLQIRNLHVAYNGVRAVRGMGYRIDEPKQRGG